MSKNSITTSDLLSRTLYQNYWLRFNTWFVSKFDDGTEYCFLTVQDIIGVLPVVIYVWNTEYRLEIDFQYKVIGYREDGGSYTDLIISNEINRDDFVNSLWWFLVNLCENYVSWYIDFTSIPLKKLWLKRREI